MNIIFSPQAESELDDAVAYYEGEQACLGSKFWQEVEEHIEWILVNHSVPRVREGDYQRVNLKIFPFFIAYSVRGNSVIIHAICHGHRKPEYWIDRIKERS